MPNDNARRKQHIRSQQLPGENYTSAMRRLDAAAAAATSGATPEAECPRWELDSQGMGSTEYAAELDGRAVVVTFQGDHRRPWTGWWNALAGDEDTSESPDANMDGDDDVDAGGACLASGRYRFESAHPDDDAVDRALAQITEAVRAAVAGGHVETIDPSHGDLVTAREAHDGGSFFIAVGEDWRVAELICFDDPYDPEDPEDEDARTFRVDDDGSYEALSLTWDGSAWSDQDGNSAVVARL